MHIVFIAESQVIKEKNIQSWSPVHIGAKVVASFTTDEYSDEKKDSDSDDVLVIEMKTLK